MESYWTEPDWVKEWMDRAADEEVNWPQSKYEEMFALDEETVDVALVEEEYARR